MSKKQKSDLPKVLKSLGFSPDWCLICDRLDDYVTIMTQLVVELSKYYEIPHTLPEPKESPDFQQFSVQLGKFIEAYGCPYWEAGDNVHEKLATAANRVPLLHYFSSEVLATRLANTPQAVASGDEKKIADHDMHDYEDIARASFSAFKALGVTCPSTDTDMASFFNALKNGITNNLSRCPPNHMGKPVLPLIGVSDRQWSQISRIAALLQQEYSCRQSTLLKRVDVTIQSFKWADKAKSHLEQISSVYNPIRKIMDKFAFPMLPNVLAVRDNQILRIEKTSGLNARKFTVCELNKVLIGKVPDRGGRVWETEPPPPEMPSFKQRQTDGGRGGGGFQRGGRGGGGSGRGGGYHGDNMNSSAYGAYQQTNYNTPHGGMMGGGGYFQNQQMGGQMFESGLSIGQNYAYQHPNSYNTGYNNPNFSRGRGGRGRR